LRRLGQGRPQLEKEKKKAGKGIARRDEVKMGGEVGSQDTKTRKRREPLTLQNGKKGKGDKAQKKDQKHHSGRAIKREKRSN